MRRRNAVRRTSIVDSFDKPALRTQVFVKPIQRGLRFATPSVFGVELGPQRPDLYVPLLACPGGFRPPVTFSSPRSGKSKNLPPYTLATDKCRLSILKFHGGGKWRPIDSHGYCCSVPGGRVFFRHFR